jgi:hypothetical protein
VVVYWIGRAQDRDKWRALLNGVINFQVPWNAGKLSSGYTACGVQLSRVSQSVKNHSLKVLAFTCKL